MDLQNLPLHTKAIVESCDNERFSLMGLKPGEEIEIICECPFKGTIEVCCRQGKFCIRRNEVNIEVKI